MLILVSYDVSTMDLAGRNRLQRVSKICLNYGVRVQNSVFECLVDSAKFEELRFKLVTILNHSEDSLRIYHLGDNWKRKVEHYGTKVTPNLEAPLIL
ncbi:CRISPR-associated protein Cas2 [Clostridiaceae bacterium JG1575]|nr:CRISPR-associated protein Cas2 [Clostridiaceae bacterium JG1575]